ncbi:hypothetical protein ACO3H4_12520 [Pseudomonas aeruginosa]|uniref:hypothetical protein n=1 Tax=Pseudomonas aeruginosa TaxID=287 RepID=UPI0004023D7F|nr:hypothetical protein [Pseudomonas aeruginosa]EIU7187648.1 hypothetical protein [Pseudomonas aeruginosa]ELO0956593.1 hypothetical protein [Pseudomonas aeruginosa]MBI7173917.1 hypothetical protein [Pseudomonas aeruginosa]MBV5893341.1 ATP-binding protein [Pseudomonas aeruginosa]MCO2611041.1 hypothetical protein [Pseudomonas aeruginosa]
MGKSLNSHQSVLCFGRDQLVVEVTKAAKRNGAVLLFGGRQSGKTTLLRKLTEVLAMNRGDVTTLSSLDIPVFVDLMRLPVDATPETFFSLLTSIAVTQCARQIDGFDFSREPEANAKRDPLSQFVLDLEDLNRCCGEVEVHLIFLLDEAKRILSDRFPRGFQDNLFALLYGEAELRPVGLSIVFAGAQHLYKLSEDDTSPIGSRAAPIVIRNLLESDVMEYCQHAMEVDEPRQETYSGYIYSMAGGHAGLTAKLIDELSGKLIDAQNIDTIHEVILTQNRGLLDNWIGSLTPEAICIANNLIKVKDLSLGDIAQCLSKSNLNQFSASRVADELCFTGVSRIVDKRLSPANHIFWSYFSSSAVARSNEESTHATWRLIEETELTLRNVVFQAYVTAFGQDALAKMKKVLGDATWEKILAIQEKSAKQYKLSRQPDNRDLMSCMYIGDLQALIISNIAWANFKPFFRDKRELEDLIKAIAPVRNDRAHFSVVPEKELERCRIACDDLIVLFEQTV